MRLGYYGSQTRVQREYKEKFGAECPEWVLEYAEQVPHQDILVEEITSHFGFYREEIDPLYSPGIAPREQPEFENEFDYMTPVAKKLIPPLIGGDVVVTEFIYGEKYRTDLAICGIDADKLARRAEITDGDDRSLVDEWKFLKGYRYLRDSEPKTYDEFAESGPYKSASTNKRVWNRLEEMGLLVHRSDYGAIINMPIHGTMHAVELKQSDWETAFEQARRAALPHRVSDSFHIDRDPQKYGYADYVWVALDAAHIHKALEHRDRFENGGVGLISLAEGAAVKIIDARRFNPPTRSLDRENLNEKIIDVIDLDDYVDMSNINRQSQLFEGEN